MISSCYKELASVSPRMWIYYQDVVERVAVQIFQIWTFSPSLFSVFYLPTTILELNKHGRSIACGDRIACHGREEKHCLATSSLNGFESGLNPTNSSQNTEDLVKHWCPIYYLIQSMIKPACNAYRECRKSPPPTVHPTLCLS